MIPVILVIRDDQLFENMTAMSILELNMACESELIRRRGAFDGHIAGSWIIDGNTDDNQIKRLVEGIEAGDPMYMDQLPQPRLGGEMSDDPTWEDILRDELRRPPNDDGEMDLLGIYEQAFRDDVQAEIMKTARARGVLS